MTTTVIQYVLARLHDIGVGDVFGVPGDYAFAVNDAICEHPDINWIGCCNGTQRRLCRRRLRSGQGSRRGLHDLWRR